MRRRQGLPNRGGDGRPFFMAIAAEGRIKAATKTGKTVLLGGSGLYAIYGAGDRYWVASQARLSPLRLKDDPGSIFAAYLASTIFINVRQAQPLSLDIFLSSTNAEAKSINTGRPVESLNRDLTPNA